MRARPRREPRSRAAFMKMPATLRVPSVARDARVTRTATSLRRTPATSRKNICGVKRTPCYELLDHRPTGCSDEARNPSKLASLFLRLSTSRPTKNRRSRALQRPLPRPKVRRCISLALCVPSRSSRTESYFSERCSAYFVFVRKDTNLLKNADRTDREFTRLGGRQPILKSCALVAAPG